MKTQNSEGKKLELQDINIELQVDLFYSVAEIGFHDLFPFYLEKNIEQ